MGQIFLLGLFSAIVPFGLAQQPAPKSYRDPSTGVTFKVPAAWEPDTASAKVMLTVPETLKGTSAKAQVAFTFRGSVFAYASWPATDITSCLQKLQVGEFDDTPESVTIAGTDFQELSVENDGMCHERRDMLDVALVHGRCVAFDRQTNASCLPLDTSEGRALAAKEATAADQQLEGILQSVRLDKTEPRMITSKDEPQIVAARQALFQRSSWTSGFSPVMMGSTRPLKEIRAGVPSVLNIYYAPNAGPVIPLSVVADPRLHRAFAMRLGKDFFVSEGAIMYAATIEGSQLVMSPSFATHPYSGLDGSKMLTSIFGNLSDLEIAKGAAADHDFRIGLAKGIPPDFWSSNGLLSSKLGQPSVASVEAKEGDIVLDLKSEGGKYSAILRISVAEKRVVSVQVSKPSEFLDITPQYP